jgi:hypothetical protein
MSSVALCTQGGVVSRVPVDATAFPNRDASHDIHIVGSWMPEDAEPERHFSWVRETFRALEPFSRGCYVNFTSDDTLDRISSAAYSPEQWARLTALKGKFDPTNFFRLNANIPPNGKTA